MSCFVFTGEYNTSIDITTLYFQLLKDVREVRGVEEGVRRAEGVRRKKEVGRVGH